MSASSEPPDLDQLWANEAHDRLDAYDRGELEAVDVEELFAQLGGLDA